MARSRPRDARRRQATSNVELESAGRVDLKRKPRLHVGGDGSSGDNNNGAAFPTIPFGGAVFGPQPRTAPDFSRPFVGNFFKAIGPFLVRGVISNITGFVKAASPPVDAVDQETAAAQQVADAYGVPFLGIRGMSDGPGDPLNLPGFPFSFFVYRRLASDNAAIATEAFLQNGDATGQLGIGSRRRGLHCVHCQAPPGDEDKEHTMNTTR